MEDPIKVWELSKDKTGLPVDLCVIDINEDYQDDDYKVSVDDYPSRLIMQNYYDDSDNKEFVHISIDKDNPQLIEDKLNISIEDFETVREFIKKHYEDFNDYICENIDIEELKNNIYKNNDVHNFYDNLINELNPITKEEYIKALSLGYGTGVWNNNQEFLFEAGVISFDEVISNREDLYEYLINHNLSDELALEIMTFIRKGRAFSDVEAINNCTDSKMKEIWKNPKRMEKWKYYQKIMHDKKCDDWLIEVCSNIIFLPERNMAVDRYMRITKNETIPFDINNI